MENNNRIPVYEFIVDVNELYTSEQAGLKAIAIVDEPAILVDFLKFSKQNKFEQFKVQDKEKRILTGPAMIAGMRIYRQDENVGEYYGYFSKQTIQDMVQAFFKKGLINNFNLNHNSEDKANDCFIIESWFTGSENDKSKELGYNLPEGSWMISVKVDNEEIWNNYLKTGELNGFSVEVYTDALKVFAKNCPIDADVVAISKMKKAILEAEIDKYKFNTEQGFEVEYWNKKCTCKQCLELKALGYCLPGVLPKLDAYIKKHKVI